MEPVLIIGGDMRNFHLFNLCRSKSIKARLMGFDRINQSCSVERESVLDQKMTVGPIPLTVDGLSVHMPFSDTKMTLDEFGSIFLTHGKFITGVGGFQLQPSRLEVVVPSRKTKTSTTGSVA